MALIDKNILLQIADRAAYQYKILTDAGNDSRQEGIGFYTDIVTGTNNPDLEIPMLQYALQADRGFDPQLLARGARLITIVFAMMGHFARQDNDGQVLQHGGWDGYLQSQDERVSFYFAELFRAALGRRMIANNVFSESNDNFATIEIGSGGDVEFTDGVNYGTGAQNNFADGSNFAPTELQLRVDSMGPADVELRIELKKVYNSIVDVDVLVPGGTAPGELIAVGAPGIRYLDVIGVDFVPGGPQGTVGDIFTVWNKKEREIAL